MRVPLMAVLFLVLSATAFAGDRTRAPLAAMKAAPPVDFTLTDLDGETVKLSDFRGKVVVVNFWATWCPPCRVEMPSMQRAWVRFQKDDIMLLAIDVGEDEDRVAQFMADLELDFPVLLDTDSAVTNAWPVKGLPTTIVIAPDGHMAYRAIGAREWDDEGIVGQLKGLK